MAYSEHIISAMSDVPTLVHAFATTLGFDVSGTTANPIVRHPNYNGAGPGGVAFALSSITSGVNRDIRWTAQETISGIVPKSTIRAPIFATPADPTVAIIQHPQKVYLIGMLTPEPFIAIVTEHGYNLYRHLYLGFMEKIGNYQGGEVISSQNGPITNFGGSSDMSSRSRKNFLFSNVQTAWADDESGGVRVVHADNTVTWRRFRNPRGAIVPTAYIGDEVLGGFSDSINDPLVAKAQSQFSGANILIPANLYTTQVVTGDIRFRAIGKPTGVRLVNTQFIEPRSVLTVGAETWRAFAATSKQDSGVEPAAGGGAAYRLYESSVYLGYAYRSN